MSTSTIALVCARGTEEVAAEELRRLELPGAKHVEVRPGALVWDGTLEEAYRVGLFHRTSTRVLWQLFKERFDHPDELYEAALALPWEEHLNARLTFAVDTALGAGRRDHDARFLSLRVKDALCDRLREVRGERPDVERRDPDLRLNLHWAEEVTLAVDLFGPLHRRGYRPRGAPAPLKETLAAAMLSLSGWKPEQPLVDPMCGSGTLLVEAALMCSGVAPGKHRELGGWLGHDSRLWNRLLDEAEAQEREVQLKLFGFDADERAISLARQSLRAAGFDGRVSLKRGKLKELKAPAGEPGHLIVNPPYGERLGEAGELGWLYEQLGDVLKDGFGGWNAHILTANKALEKRVGLKADARHPLFNGPLACRLSSYEVRARKGEGPGWRKPSPAAAPFANRFKKNVSKLSRWAKGEGIGVWRAYDADIPEFNVAVDVYELDGGQAALVQEYRRPHKVDPRVADQRLRDAVLVVKEALGTDRVELRVRKRQGEGQQYERRASGSDRLVVKEGGHKFWLNLDDYLDTGLFPDQRKLRAHMAKEAAGGSFLNLFSYTCTASVYAAAAGARTTSVDLSNTYLDWGTENFELNGIDPRKHHFQRADILRWLEQGRERWDVVFMAPPSYSRSKSMRQELDLVRDHDWLIEMAMERTRGELYFATHARQLELDPRVSRLYQVTDIRKKMVPRDHLRSTFKIWRISHRR